MMYLDLSFNNGFNLVERNRSEIVVVNPYIILAGEEDAQPADILSLV